MARRVASAEDVLARAAALAASQAGVLSRRDALACGLTPAQLVTLVRRGEWTALTGGCLAPVPRATDPVLAALEVAAAIRLRAPCQERFVGAGAVAARVHGLPLLVDDASVRVIDRWPPPGRTRAWSVRLRDEDVVRRRGVLVTSLSRTAADLSRQHGLLSGVVAADAALRRGARQRDLRAAAGHLAPVRGGSTATRAAELARHTAESPLESIGRVQLVLAGLPEPAGQRPVHDARGFVGRVDHAWSELRVIGEADGRTKYEPDEQDEQDAATVRWREKQREDRLRVGFEVFRYTWAEAVHAPEILVAKAVEAFDAASRRWRLPSWRAM